MIPNYTALLFMSYIIKREREFFRRKIAERTKDQNTFAGEEKHSRLIHKIKNYELVSIDGLLCEAIVS